MTALLPELGVDLFSPGFQRDPYPGWARLRAEAPVYREPAHGGFVLTRFADVYGALRDHDTFSSRFGVTPRLTPSSVPTIVTSDPPTHTHLRTLVNRAFTPRRVAALRPRIEEVVAQLLHTVDDRETDIVAALAYPLPVTVIAELLGVPLADREQFKRWSEALVGAFEKDPASIGAEAFEMFEYFMSAYATRRETPTDDLLTGLLQADVEGQRLNDFELVIFAVILLVAGHETTTNLLGNLLAVLSTRPEVWRQLREQPPLAAAAIEELLRFDSPVQVLGRATMREVVLHGVTIPEMSRVFVAFASANRDETEFADADVFRLDRQLSRHVAFGHGIHYCLGAPLARLESEVALRALTTRYEAIEQAGEGRRKASTMLRGWEALPLRMVLA